MQKALLIDRFWVKSTGFRRFLQVLKEMRAQCGSLTLAKVGLSTLHLIQEAEAYRPSASGEMKQALSMLEHKAPLLDLSAQVL